VKVEKEGKTGLGLLKMPEIRKDTTWKDRGRQGDTRDQTELGRTEQDMTGQDRKRKRKTGLK
jgi:hypothetical protein